MQNFQDLRHNITEAIKNGFQVKLLAHFIDEIDLSKSKVVVHEKKFKFGFKALSSFVSKVKDARLAELEKDPAKVSYTGSFSDRAQLRGREVPETKHSSGQRD